MFMVLMIIPCTLLAVFLARKPITLAGKAIIIACVPVGGVVGFALGMVIACDCGAFEMGNMCGLFAVFITGPIGSIVGGVA